MAKTVIVASKLATPLLLQLRQEHPDPALRSVVKEVAIKGFKTDIAPYTLENGVGLTDVDAEFWEMWEKWALANQFAPYMNGMIFAHTTGASVKAEAVEKAAEPSGFEGLRMPLKEGESVKPDPRLSEFGGTGLTVNA